MKKTLSDQDRSRLDGLIADLEKRTNTQIVLAVIKRSDSYAELPWKAFALGTSLAGIVIFIVNLISNSWDPWMMTLIAIATVLASGAVFASLTILSHQVARQFLAASRAEVEVRQYAESLFLSRELFATKKRTGILMLVSLFERRVIIIPDKGLHDRLTADILQRIIASMTPLLKRNEIKRAFEAGLERISHTLGTRTRGKGKNELPDDIIEEKGL